MGELQIGDLLSQSWNKTFTRGGAGMMLAMLLACLAWCVVCALLSRLGDSLIAMFVGGVAALGVCFILVGLTHNMLQMARGTVAGYSKEACRLPLIVVAHFAVAYVLMGFIVTVAFMLLIVPGLIIGPRVAFAPLAILADHSLSVVEAFRRSWRMTRGHVCRLWLLFLACYLITVLGGFLFGVGALAASVLAGIALWLAFLQLDEWQKAGTTAVATPDGGGQHLRPLE